MDLISRPTISLVRSRVIAGQPADHDTQATEVGEATQGLGAVGAVVPLFNWGHDVTYIVAKHEI